MEQASGQTLLFIVAGLAALAVIAGLVFALYSFRRSTARGRLFMADADQTYLVRSETGGPLRALERPEEILNPDAFVVKPGAQQRHLAYCHFDETTGEARLCRLMADDGAVSLRLQTGAPRPFLAYTKDRHPVQVFAKLRFRLDRNRLADASSFDDFAAVLEDRIQSALRAEIGARRDEELREDQTAITQAVAGQLQAFETQEGGTVGAPLGIVVFDMSFHYEEFSSGQPLMVAPVPLKPDDAGETDGNEDAAATSNVLPVSFPGTGLASRTGSGSRAGAMQFSELQLDKIGDVFNERPAESTAALLRLIELQTQQNIVEILSQSGGLVVLTSQELGLDPELLTRSLRSAERPSDGEATPADIASLR